MLNVIQTKSLHLLETLVNTLESYEDIQKRPRYFAQPHQEEQEQDQA